MKNWAGAIGFIKENWTAGPLDQNAEARGCTDKEQTEFNICDLLCKKLINSISMQVELTYKTFCHRGVSRAQPGRVSPNQIN